MQLSTIYFCFSSKVEFLQHETEAAEAINDCVGVARLVFYLDGMSTLMHGCDEVSLYRPSLKFSD